MLSAVRLYFKNFLLWIKSGGVVKYRYVTPAIFDKRPLEGRVAIITGGTSGIGLATAKSLSQMGAKVILTGRNKQKIENAINQIDGAIGVEWDITDVTLANDMMVKCKSFYGRLDILINNAGIYDGTPMEKMSEQIFDAVINTDCKGSYFISKSFVEYCEASDNCMKKIINILSIRSLTSGTNAYCIAKWGAKCFSDGLAKEVMNKNIIVNNVAPGPTVSNINTDNIYAGTNAFCDGQERAKYYLEPSEVANVIAFLASDISNGIVGQTIVVDGGETIR